MVLDQGIQPWHSTAGTSFGEDSESPRTFSPSLLPVLIQVPTVRIPARAPRQARRPSAAATERARAYAIHRGTFPPRRRLRKEVRLAVYGLLLTATMGLAAALIGGTPATMTGEDVGDRARASAAGRPPGVPLSVEPTAVAPGAEPGFPVVLPGYLLPDDGIEEPAHAGG